MEEVSIDPNVAEKQEGDAGFINYNRDVLSVVFEQLKVIINHIVDLSFIFVLDTANGIS